MAYAPTIEQIDHILFWAPEAPADYVPPAPRVFSGSIDERVFDGSYPLKELAAENRANVTLQEVRSGWRHQQLGVGVIDGRTRNDKDQLEGETIVYALGFKAVLDRFELQRLEQAALELGKRFIVVEQPGIGAHSPRIRLMQALGQLFGGFKSTGKAMAKAAWQAADLKKVKK